MKLKPNWMKQMNKLQTLSTNLTLLNYILDPEMSSEFKRTITNKKPHELLKEACENLTEIVEYIKELETKLNNLEK